MKKDLVKHLEKTLDAVRLFLRAQEEYESKSCLQETPWTDEPGGSQSTGSQELDTTQQLNLVAQLVKKSACNVRDLSSIPGLGRSPGEGKGYPLQYPGLENSR